MKIDAAYKRARASLCRRAIARNLSKEEFVKESFGVERSKGGGLWPRDNTFESRSVHPPSLRDPHRSFQSLAIDFDPRLILRITQTCAIIERYECRKLLNSFRWTITRSHIQFNLKSRFIILFAYVRFVL